jgi:CHASE2 domain-containing sensor protein
MKRKTLWLESFWISLLTLIVLYCLFLLINISFKPLNYIVQTISSICLNDLYFSSVANNHVDTNIVLVNIEDLDREGITNLINKVDEGNPKVIGLDVFFSREIKTPHDSLLWKTLFRLRDKIVMAVTSTENQHAKQYWTVPTIKTGHAGLLTNENNTEVIRKFEPFLEGDSGSTISFSAALVKMFDPDAYNHLTYRNNQQERIHYIGNGNAFQMIQAKEILNASSNHLNLFNQKIVIIGFSGNKIQCFNDMDDAFFTPVGFDFNVNRRPDMHGMIIHANITSMILGKHYINHVPFWLVMILNFVLLYFHALLFAWLFIKTPLFYTTIALATQTISFILVLWASFILLTKTNLYLETSLILATIALSANILYLYPPIAIMSSRKWKWKSVFYQTSNP